MPSPCALLSRCGSCPLLPLPYEAQLAQKQAAFEAQLAPLLERIAPERRPAVLSPVASPTPLGYRQSVKLVTQEGYRGAKLGLYRPGTHEVIDTSGCPVQSDRINALLDHLRGALREEGAPSLYDERSGRGALRYVVVREAFSVKGEEPSLHLTLIAAELSEALERLAGRLAQEQPALTGVSVHLNQSDGNAIFDWSSEPLMRPLYGEGSLVSTFELREGLPLKLMASAESFSQVNPSAASLAYRAVIEGLDPAPGERALDLYCGVGSLSLALAQAGCVEVVGLEESPSSVRDARLNAAHNQLEVRFVVGLTEELLPAEVRRLTQVSPLTRSGAGLESREVVVSLNPSRRGCQAAVIEQLAWLKPRRLAYMSCHPRTLIRDLRRLLDRGYAPTSLQLFDLFPGTPHFEVVCVIEPLEGL